MSQPQASNPANIRIHYLTFLRSHPITPALILGSFLLALLLLLCGADLKLHIIPLALLFTGLTSLYEARNLFESGNLCPAIVIDQKCGLVAAYTDLSTGRSPCPAIDIFTCHLGLLPGGPYKNGDRLALAAFYKGNPNAPHWVNFGGYLVQAGTPKPKLWKRALASIDDEDWELLEAGLAELKQPFRKGQYLNLKFQPGRKLSLTSHQPRAMRDVTNDTGQAPNFVQVQCPHCREVLKSKRPEILGKRLACPRCKELFIAKAHKPKGQSPEGDDLFESERESKQTHRSPLLLWIAILGLFVLLIFGTMFLVLPRGQQPGVHHAGQPPNNVLQPAPPSVSRKGFPTRRSGFNPLYGQHDVMDVPITIPIPAGYGRASGLSSLPQGTKVKYSEDNNWKSATVHADRDLFQVLVRLDEQTADPDVLINRDNLIAEKTVLREIRKEHVERSIAAQKHREEMDKNATRPPQKLPDSPDAAVKLVLTDVGSRKSDVAALIVEITDLTLKEAEEFIANPPLILLQKVPKWEAEKWADQIAKVGGTAVIENITPEPPK